MFSVPAFWETFESYGNPYRLKRMKKKPYNHCKDMQNSVKRKTRAEEESNEAWRIFAEQIDCGERDMYKNMKYLGGKRYARC